jgi:hypothetical protein
MLRSRLALLVWALVPASGLAAPTDQVHALRQQIAALQLDHALNLTQLQAKELLPLLQDMKGKVSALKAERASAEPALVAALTQAVADLKANGAVSDSTVTTVQAARGGSGAGRQDMASSWQQAKQVLTAEQLQTLKTARLGIGRPAVADAGASATHGNGQQQHFGRRFRVMRALLSDDFVSLVQARAG